jgi:hypothetical protein
MGKKVGLRKVGISKGSKSYEEKYAPKPKKKVVKKSFLKKFKKD